MADIYYPYVSDLITIDQLPDGLSFISDDLNGIFSKLRYQNVGIGGFSPHNNTYKKAALYFTHDTTNDINFMKALHKFGFASFRVGPARTILKAAADNEPLLRNLVIQETDSPQHNTHLHSTKFTIINNSDKTL